MFEGRQILVATKHRKETVIGPIVQEELGAKPFVLSDFDTDNFGTFTGEIERMGSPIDVLRKKAEHGMEMTGVDLAVASEGSFGPHPTLVFIPAADELLMLKDSKNNLEIVARELTTNTNFGSKEVTDEEELFRFAEKSLFPSHALILSAPNSKSIPFIKGIQTEEELLAAFKYIKHKVDKVLVQTDMRAMYNPTRMNTIEVVCHKLIQYVKSVCPVCTTPGFVVTEVVSGLPCSLCGRATRSTLAHLYKCKKCTYEEQRYYPNQKEEEEPTFCDYCNP